MTRTLPHLCSHFSDILTNTLFSIRAMRKARPGNKNTRLTYKIGSKSGGAAPLPIFLLHVMCVELTKGMIATLKDAAAKLTGATRRAFQAQVTKDYLNGSLRRAERVFGWRRQNVETGLHELRTGIKCVGDFNARGNKKLEEKLPKLEHDIRALAEPHSQQDPNFQSPFLYTRMTAAAMRKIPLVNSGARTGEL